MWIYVRIHNSLFAAVERKIECGILRLWNWLERNLMEIMRLKN